VKVAWAELRRTVASDVEPSTRLTVPVALDGTTLTEKVTAWPDVDGLGDALRYVAVVVFAAAVTYELPNSRIATNNDATSASPTRTSRHWVVMRHRRRPSNHRDIETPSPKR
jgi:hypothetical protein